jgi:Na+/H+-dicarboxylate symporter
MVWRLSLPIQLVLMIIFTMIFGGFLPEIVVRFAYTISFLLKEILEFLLPFIIFSFVFIGLASFKRNAPFVLAVLLISIFISNAVVALFSYVTAMLILPSLVTSLCAVGTTCYTQIDPLFTFCLPKLFRGDYVLLAAVGSGLLIAFFPLPGFERTIQWSKQQLEKFFTYIFVPFLPVYVLGFLLKIQYEGVFWKLVENYGAAIVLIIILQWVCIVIAYLIATGFDIGAAFRAMRNAMDSYLTAFATMSSTATVPVSIQSAQKNIDNEPLAHMAMPILANVHLMGDSVGTPILALTTLLAYVGAFPGPLAFLIFVWNFSLAMFGVSGVPAGGIIVMIPILQGVLGLTPEMTSVMMVLYILLDPFGTSANVMGDGALVMIVNKMIKRLQLT